MSAYVVNDETINKVLSFLHLKAQRDRHFFPLRPFAELGYDLIYEKECRRLGQDLFQLNIRAVEGRYPDCEASEFRSLNYMFSFLWPPSSVQVYKSLGCLRYQCAEEDVPGTELFKAMTETRYYLAIDIVEKSDEYERGIWG